MKKIIISTVALIITAVFAACLLAPEEVLERDNSGDPKNPVNLRSITVNLSGEESGEGLSAGVLEGPDGTEITLTAALSSDTYRMVSLSAEGATLGSSLILSNGGTSEFTISGSDVTVTAEFTDRNIEEIIRAAEQSSDDQFGGAVAVSGDYAIVGADWEDGDSGDTVPSAGAAYIFKNDGSGSWSQIQVLHASNMETLDYFGTSVAIDDDCAIIGAEYEDGDENLKTFSGAAYIFRNDGNDNWTEEYLLRASDAEETDHYGGAVGISGDYAIVGAKDEDDTGNNSAGAAYIYKHDGSGGWDEVEILHADNLGPGDVFGCSVSISGDYAIIGAYGEDGDASNTVSSAGAAYIFKNDGSGSWSQVEILHASDLQEGDQFGWSVSIDGNYAIVGADCERGGDGDPAANAGAAYIFKNDGSGSWNQVQILHAGDMQASDYYGDSVGISGNYAIVGAVNEDGGDGDPEGWAGAAYIYKLDGNSWTESAILHNSDMQSGDHYGGAVAISGGCAVIGAYEEDGGTGDPVSNAGAAYIINNIVY